MEILMILGGLGLLYLLIKYYKKPDKKTGRRSGGYGDSSNKDDLTKD